MSRSSAKPYNQKRRIALLRVTSALVLLPLIVLTRPLWEAGWPRDITRLIGTLLIVVGVLGRFWAILYIGTRKNKAVMQDGPYSVCRHPLYLSSTLGVAGFGFLLGSFVIAAVMTAAIFAILSRTARREEAFLRAEFGPAYDEYASNFGADRAAADELSGCAGLPHLLAAGHGDWLDPRCRPVADAHPALNRRA